MGDALYFGDNLDVLREHIRDETIDLIYLDPPFNSNADYNVLFKSKKGTSSQSQIRAFTDTWGWGDDAAAAYDEVRRSRCDAAASLIEAFRSALGTSDMMAYLAMMAVRLIELRRVLKPTGTLYLHCDPTASHYLKLVLDAIFGARCFRNEIIWLRSTPKGHAFTRFASGHDVILAYGRTAEVVWNPSYRAYSEAYIKSHYGMIEAETGRRFQPTSLINPNANRPNLRYEFGGHTKVWRWTRDRMKRAEEAGRIYFPPGGGVPREKRYLDEQEGTPIASVWTDIPPINARAQERLGYPTQKPLALLERVLAASSNAGTVVLDPFCGCGTTIEAAHRLGRSWIGIDIAYDAIRIIEQRLRDRLNVVGTPVIGAPRTAEDAAELARRYPFQFQIWATYLARGVPKDGGKKGADRGIDGYIRYTGPRPGTAIVSVKGGGVEPSMVRDLAGVVGTTGAQFGAFITLIPPTREMEIAAAAAGTVPLGSRSLPRVQIRTIEQLLAGRRFDLPAMPDEFVPAPAAEREARKRGRGRRPDPDAPELLLPIPGDQAPPAVALPEPMPKARRRSAEGSEHATTRMPREAVDGAR